MKIYIETNKTIWARTRLVAQEEKIKELEEQKAVHLQNLKAKGKEIGEEKAQLSKQEQDYNLIT